MKKIITCLIMIAASSACFAQEIKITQTGKWLANVTGHAPKRCWLGVTVIVDGVEQDLKVKRVKGNISESVAMPGGASAGAAAIAKNRDVAWVASLWEDKVTKCGCKYCRKNGYHMEGRLARDSD